MMATGTRSNTQRFDLKGVAPVNKLFFALGKMLFGGVSVKTENGFGIIFGIVMFIWAIVDIVSFFSER